LIIDVADFTGPKVLVGLKDLYLTLNTQELKEHVLGELTNAQIKYLRPIDVSDPDQELDNLLEQFEHLIFDNKAHDIELRAMVNVSISEQPVELEISTQQDGDDMFLGFNPEDVIAASSQFGLTVGSEEANVIARHPGAVPDMLRITKEARDKSRERGQADSSFPEDAFRHVYCSYHLTRELGEDLSKQITDAHETVAGNTPAQRSMDYHNNEIARSLANTVLSDDQLAQYVLTSTDVIRYPEE